MVDFARREQPRMSTGNKFLIGTLITAVVAFIGWLVYGWWKRHAKNRLNPS